MHDFLADSLRLLFGSLANASVQITFLSIMAFVAKKCFSRHSAAFRHRILAVTLLCGVLLPVLNAFDRPQIFATVWQKQRRTIQNGVSLSDSGKADHLNSKDQTNRQASMEFNTEPSAAASRRLGTSEDVLQSLPGKQSSNWFFVSKSLFNDDYVKAVTACVWILGTTVLLVRFFFGQWLLRRLRREAHSKPSECDLNWVKSVATNSCFRHDVAVRCSAIEHTPMTWGILRPTILLPKSFVDWPAARRRAAILHELAHVRRWDSLWQFLSRLFCVLFWFHPGAWWLKWQLNVLCEKACDDEVIASGERASDYADALLFVAKTTHHRFLTAGIAMVHDGSLKDRIEHLFNTRVSHSQIIHRVSLGIGVLVAFAAMLIAQMQPCRGFVLFEFTQQEPADSAIALSSFATDAAGDAILTGARLQFGTKRFRPATTVDQLLLSPDEKTVVSLGGVLIAWDAQTGKEKWRIPGHQLGATEGGYTYGHRPMAFAENGKSFFTLGRDGQLIEWELDSPNPKTRIEAKRNVANNRVNELASLDIVGNGDRFAMGNAFGLTVADASGQEIFRIENTDFPPVPPRDPNEPRDRLRFHGEYSLVRYSPDKQQLACVFSESPKELRMLDSKDGTELQRIALTDKAVRIDYSPNGSQIVVSERDSAVRLYEASTGKLIWTFVAELSNPYENFTTNVVFSPDGSKVVAGASDNHLHVLSAKDGRELGQLIGHGWYPWSMVFSADSQRLFSSGLDGKIRRWDMRTMKELSLEKSDYGTSVIAGSPDGKWIAAVYEKRIALLSVKDGKEMASLPAERLDVSQVAFSADSQFMAIGAADGKQVLVSLWDVSTAKKLHEWGWELGKDPHSNVEALAFSPDGRKLAAAVHRQSSVNLWDLKSKNLIARLKHNGVNGIDFESNSETLVTVGFDTHLRKWDVETGVLVRDCDWNQDKQGDLLMYAVSCSAVGDLLATAHSNGAIKIWNRSEMTLRSEIQVGGRFIFGALAFSKDGLWLASGDASGQVCIWDPFTGGKAMDVGKHESYAFTVCFGNDLQTVISGGADGMAYQWDLRRGMEKWTAEPDALWEVLRKGPASDAFGVIQALSQKPEVAVELIARKLKAVDTLVDPFGYPDRAAVYSELVGQNDHDEYAHAARRAVTILAQTEGIEARKLLQELASRGADDPIGELAHVALWGKQKKPR